VGSWGRLPWVRKVKTADVSQEGNGKDVVSPTGSTHRRRPMRVTKDKVTASRARLHDGQQAPVSCRPRTHAGGSRISRDCVGRKPLPDSSSRAVGGRARRKGCMDSFGEREGSRMTVTYDKEITALLVIDPYNDFISEGGKLWDRLKAVAEANNCVPHM